jgi:chromosomal replication initiation ATPase DnaA
MSEESRKFSRENQSRLLALVSKKFVVEPEEMIRQDRRSRQSNARHVAMSLMKILMDCTYAEVGTVFNRNYSTVIVARRKVDKSRKLLDIALEISKEYAASFKSA